MLKKIIVAIDEIEILSFMNIVDHLDPNKCMVKIGSVSFNSIGNKAIEYVSKKGFEIFLDLKLHDIPNTCVSAIKAIKDLKVNYLTIHISSGLQALKDAKKVSGSIRLVGVSILN